jgi:hypothetical protein
MDQKMPQPRHVDDNLPLSIVLVFGYIAHVPLHDHQHVVFGFSIDGNGLAGAGGCAPSAVGRDCGRLREAPHSGVVMSSSGVVNQTVPGLPEARGDWPGDTGSLQRRGLSAFDAR